MKQVLSMLFIGIGLFSMHKSFAEGHVTLTSGTSISLQPGTELTVVSCAGASDKLPMCTVGRMTTLFGVFLDGGFYASFPEPEQAVRLVQQMKHAGLCR